VPPSRAAFCHGPGTPRRAPDRACRVLPCSGALYAIERSAAVDKKRIGLWGGSYGGLLTALGLARNPELFRGHAMFLPWSMV
jgi:dienelactone hydrolase